MQRLRATYSILLIISTLSILVGCSEEQKRYKIGMSQCAFDTNWRLEMNRHLTANAMQRGNIDLIMTDGNNSNKKQIADIRWLMSQQIDLLMVSPNEADSLTPIITEVYNKGIPVILIDRKTINDSYTIFIGASNTIIGEKAADYAGLFGKPGSKIIELHGQRGASASLDRGTGFNSRINDKYLNKKFEHVADLYCEWSSKLAKQKMAEYLHNGGVVPDIIYSHNDDMATGAYDAIKEAGIDPNSIIIIGTDGASGEDGGIKAVMDDKIDATFFYPDGSEEAINAAEDILLGKTVPKNHILSTVQIDANNAEGLYGQMNMTRIQEERIIKQSATLKQQLATISTQNNVIMLIVSLLGIVIIAMAYILKLHNEKKRSNQMLNEKNAEINAQKEELESQASYLSQINEQLNEKNAEINAQKEELEAQASYLNQINEQLERNKEKIIGSIRYAQTIQTAALPTEPDLNYYFNAFVIYHPKDIVSGDFYWYHREIDTEKETHIFGLIDCTGHGVPGAFMSLIGVNLLDQIVKQRKIYSPATILDELNKAVRAALRQEETENNDGMEAVMCKIEKYLNNKTILTYEGAKFPLRHYTKSTGTLQTYKTSRRQIGGKFRTIESMVNFEDHTLEISPGDRIYMASDGIGDQHNYERRRYTSVRFEKAILSSAQMPMPEQRDYIWNDVSTYMRNCEQRDDISVLGIEV
ncbi:MAG: substrate-binding domain-containing protein [Bacteroidales bacterium]|nr:substrate-binding domain-containing protein [Bacteroidales bacterium]